MCVLYRTVLENLEKDNIGYCSVSLLMLISFTLLKISFCLLQDHVLIELTQTGMKGQDDLVREEDPYVVVHPNYVIDV